MCLLIVNTEIAVVSREAFAGDWFKGLNSDRETSTSSSEGESQGSILLVAIYTVFHCHFVFDGISI